MSLTLALDPSRLWREPARLWHAYPRETLVIGGLGLSALVALAGAAWSTPSLDRLPGRGSIAEAPPAPPPLLVRKLPVRDALAINEAIPLADGPNPSAKPFSFGNADEAARARALECLTSAIYYEAANESPDGQRGVAQVVLNRVRHPAFPASVCGVVFEGSTRATGCQFTFTCDGSLARRPSAASWARARTVAEAALAGFVFKPVGTATHYHANYVVPYWASSLAKNAVIGAHIFYRWAGGWGLPAAFKQRYLRAEPSVDSLRAAALVAEAREKEQQQLMTAETSQEQAVEVIPGAEALQLAPSMRGDKKVAIRFNLAARKAAEEAPRVEYLKKVEATENLRWSLTGAMVAEQEKPLGRPEPSTTGGGAAPGASAPQ